MKHIKNKKKHLKHLSVVFLLLILLTYSSFSTQKVSADFESYLAKEVYKTACQIINDKFYLKPKINIISQNKINNINDAYKNINKIIKQLKDPYTIFLTKEEFKEEQDLINSSFTGIGVKLEAKKPRVIEVLSGSPADNEGLKPDDYILKVNNKSTKHLNTKQVTNLLRGEEGTSLTLDIQRGNNIFKKTVIRKKLSLKTVTSEVLDNGLALIKIDSFIPDNTSSIFKNEILKLMSAKGLIIDLRNNSGGLLKNAVEIADLFLTDGKIVSTLGSHDITNIYANSSKYFDSNIVVLVNEYSASASEILACALKENKKAIIVGNKTFGKGLVQEIIKLPDNSALHVTTKAYLTPNGKNINKIGIIPDEIILDKEKQLEIAKEILLDPESTIQKTKIASL